MKKQLFLALLFTTVGYSASAQSSTTTTTTRQTTVTPGTQTYPTTPVQTPASSTTTESTTTTVQPSTTTVNQAPVIPNDVKVKGKRGGKTKVKPKN